MIYFNYLFENYDEFKELFGMQEHGNGTKSRRNKILLQLVKSRTILHMMATETKTNYLAKNVWDSRNHCHGKRVKYETTKRHPYGVNFYTIDTLDKLRNVILGLLWKGDVCLSLKGLEGVRTCLYDTDDFQGICEDGDYRSIRYVNRERQRVFKMRAGKFLRKIIEEHADIDALLPEQVKIWVCEDFAERWKAHAQNIIAGDKYTLHVDKNFADIYNGRKCKGNFGSCMVNDGYWTFYRDSVDASAAYLTDAEGLIVSRCIVYNAVRDSLGNTLRLAERQYSSESNDTLKMLLVQRLIDGGHIDGYKRVGADCHSPEAFVACDGNPLKSYSLEIDCNLEDYRVVSYQDSFKWYDDYDKVSRNYGSSGEGNLSVTGGRLEEDEDDHEDDRWSDYHDEWIPEDDAYYIDSRDDYFYSNEIVYAYKWNGNRFYREDCFEDDCIEINGKSYFAGIDRESPNDYGIYECPNCGEWFVPALEDAVYSVLTEEDYCCDSCLEEAEEKWHKDNGETFCDYDDEWYDADEVIDALRWNTRLRKYYRTYIHIDDFNDLVKDGEATEYCGRYYIDDILLDGEPAHLLAADAIAA